MKIRIILLALAVAASSVMLTGCGGKKGDDFAGKKHKPAKHEKRRG